jgi:hypothetical protein
MIIFNEQNGPRTGAGSVIFPTVLNNLIGTKFKIIIGYTNANTIDLAVERGEVESRQSYSSAPSGSTTRPGRRKASSTSSCIRSGPA